MNGFADGKESAALNCAGLKRCVGNAAREWSMLQKLDHTRRGSIVVDYEERSCTTDRDSQQPRVVTAAGFNSKELWIAHCRTCSVKKSAPSRPCTVCVALRCKFQRDVCMFTISISITSCCRMLFQVYFSLQWLVASHLYVMLVWILLVDDGRDRQIFAGQFGSNVLNTVTVSIDIVRWLAIQGIQDPMPPSGQLTSSLGAG